MATAIDQYSGSFAIVCHLSVRHSSIGMVCQAVGCAAEEKDCCAVAGSYNHQKINKIWTEKNHLEDIIH